MIPSKRWFPTTLRERSAWMKNFARQLAIVGPSLGFSAAEIDSVNKDAEDLESLAASIRSAEAFMSALREFRISLTEDRIGTPTPVPPNFSFVPPPNGVPAGIFQRLDRLVRRIRTAPAYTDEVGALLNILHSRSEPAQESEMSPSIRPSAMPGNIVEVRFTRGDTDGVSIQMQLDKDEEWRDAGRFFKSPAELQIPDGDGLPRAVRLRARYVIGNHAVGQNSDIVNVVTTP